MEEGVIHERLSILPVAKSTEVMFINKTAFDRFAKETGAKMEDLKTWEGLFAMAEQYAAWTDNQTPDIPDDGKNFFVHDYHFNYFQVGVESLGENFFKGENLAFGPEFQTVWEPYAKAALSGGSMASQRLCNGTFANGRFDCIGGFVSQRIVLFRRSYVCG